MTTLLSALIQIGLLSVVIAVAGGWWFYRWCQRAVVRPERIAVARLQNGVPRRYPQRIEPPRTVQGIAIPSRKAIGR